MRLKRRMQGLVLVSMTMITTMRLGKVLQPRLLLSSASCTSPLQDNTQKTGGASATNIASQQNHEVRVEHNPSGLTNSTATKTTTYWCVLQHNNTKGVNKFGHFPHFLQTMALCWSWFQIMNTQHHEQQLVQFGVLVKGLPGFGPVNHDWRAQLLDVMDCRYRYGVPDDFSNNNGTYGEDHSDIFFVPPVDHTNRRRYFWKPDDATALRQRLLDHVDVSHANLTTPTKGKYDIYSNRNGTGISEAMTLSTTMSDHHWSAEPIPRIQIGLVDRRKTRRLQNIDNIQKAIVKKYPMADVEQRCMEDMTPLQQMLWWSHLDVVVVAHGAAETNLIFLRRDAAVIEIFPPHYYDLFFPPLAASAGVRTYAYVNGVADPGADHAQHSRTFSQRVSRRAVDLKPKVKHILQLVDQAIQEEGNHRWSWIYPSLKKRNKR